MSNKKYDWHDLRNNPEDLPPEGLLVFLYVTYLGVYDDYTVGMQKNGVFESDQYDEAGQGFDTLAWKYIEPFIGDE